MSTDVVVTVDADGIMTATINRPRAMNALSPSVLDGLVGAVRRAESGAAPVLVIRGQGGTLSAGADLGHLLSVIDDESAAIEYVRSIGRTNRIIETSTVVSVAVVDGYALAGGCELLLSCDLGVAGSAARIGDRHLEYGLLPGAGGSVRLPRAIAPALARRLMITGEMVDGRTAHEWGLVSHLADDGDIEATLTTLTQRLARHSPTALAAMKRMILGRSGDAIDDALEFELEVFAEHLRTPALREGLAAFAGHRPPQFPDIRRTSA